MLIKIQANISNEDGNFDPGKTVDMREGVAHQWIKNKWAIDPTGEIIVDRDGNLIFAAKAKPTKATIETPESNMVAPETEAIRTRGRSKKTDE